MRAKEGVRTFFYNSQDLDFFLIWMGVEGELKSRGQKKEGKKSRG